MAIEEPFGVLALETISGTALTNIRELESMHATSALAGERSSCLGQAAAGWVGGCGWWWCAGGVEGSIQRSSIE